MKEILETIIKNLVEDKDSVEINELENEGNLTLEVKVSDKDMGKVIGKEGKIAKAIRTIMKSVAGRERKKVTVEFVD